MAALSSASEADLVHKAQQGDRNAFSELIQLHQQGVFGVVYQMCGDAHLAEDAAQEAFIRAWLHLPDYQPRSAFRNWLFRIAVNAALDMLRNEKKIEPMDIDTLSMKDSSYGPEMLSIQKDRARLVRNAIQDLPEASRVVLVLREYEELSYQEIAGILEIPPGTVMSRLNYARSRLREMLKDQLSPLEVEHV